MKTDKKQMGDIESELQEMKIVDTYKTNVNRTMDNSNTSSPVGSLGLKSAFWNLEFLNT